MTNIANRGSVPLSRQALADATKRGVRMRIIVPGGHTDAEQNDLNTSRRITYDEWSTRPFKEKAWQQFPALFGSQLKEAYAP